MTPTPKPGDRFRHRGRQDLYTVHEIEMDVASETAHPSRLCIVRTQSGARWLLSSGDPLHDDIPFVGRPLPADPTAPEP